MKHQFLDASINLFYGGEYRDRTGDLLLARQALSQLSYPPISRDLFFEVSLLRSGGPKWTRFPAGKPRRLQHATGMLSSAAFRAIFVSPDNSSVCSASYFSLALFEVVGQNGLEPSTSRLSVVCSSQLSYWPISASLLY